MLAVLLSAALNVAAAQPSTPLPVVVERWLNERDFGGRVDAPVHVVDARVAGGRFVCGSAREAFGSFYGHRYLVDARDQLGWVDHLGLAPVAPGALPRVQAMDPAHEAEWRRCRETGAEAG